MVCMLLCACGTAYGLERKAFMPENNLWMEDSFTAGGLDEATFNQAIDEVEKIYAPIFQGFGASLNIERNWTDATVNAYAQQTGNIWTVAMFGGLARRPEVTKEGFQMVICHEIGHHLGGVPAAGWASYEGESDYFALHVCAKKVFANAVGSGEVARHCAGQPDKKYAFICTVSLSAGQSLGNLLAALGGQSEPNYDTPDKSVVRVTDQNHPKAQCRLDTYLAGARCLKGWDDKKIPSNYDAVCDTRPKCWFAK